MRTAAEMEKDLASPRYLSVGCRVLDGVLGGGVCVQGVTEVRGVRIRALGGCARGLTPPSARRALALR